MVPLLLLGHPLQQEEFRLPFGLLLLEKVANLEVGLADHLGVLMEGQMVADLVDHLFLDGLVGDLAIGFPVFRGEGFLEDSREVLKVALMEEGLEVLRGALLGVDPAVRSADQMEEGLERLMVDQKVVGPEGHLVGHLERMELLRLYRRFLLRVLAPRLEFQQLLLEWFLVQEFLLLAKSTLLQESG